MQVVNHLNLAGLRRSAFAGHRLLAALFASAKQCRCTFRLCKHFNWVGAAFRNELMTIKECCA
jgi:hypothetical protein